MSDFKPGDRVTVYGNIYRVYAINTNGVTVHSRDGRMRTYPTQMVKTLAEAALDKLQEDARDFNARDLPF